MGAVNNGCVNFNAAQAGEANRMHAYLRNLPKAHEDLPAEVRLPSVFPQQRKTSIVGTPICKAFIANADPENAYLVEITATHRESPAFDQHYDITFCWKRNARPLPETANGFVLMESNFDNCVELSGTATRDRTGRFSNQAEGSLGDGVFYVTRSHWDKDQFVSETEIIRPEH